MKTSPRKASCRLAVLLAVASWAATIGAAYCEDDRALLGPIRARDMTPFGLLVLDMAPSYAVRERERGSAWEVNLQTTNNWLLSQSAEEYLMTRPDRRAPLSQEDVDALLGLGEDTFLADSGIQLLSATFHYAWNEKWAGYVTFPVHFYNGGFTDSLIEDFHDAFGFSTQGRDLMAQDEFALVANVQGEEFSQLGEPTSSGFGDPILGLRRSFQRGPWGLAVEGAVKVPIADEDDLMSTGDEDFGLQFLAQRRIASRHGIYLGVNNVWVGGTAAFDQVVADTLPGVMVAWEWAARPRNSLLLQLYVREGVIETSDDPDITSEKLQATIGWRRRGEKRIFSFAFTENLQTMNNTPDIGALFSIAWVSKPTD